MQKKALILLSGFIIAFIAGLIIAILTPVNILFVFDQPRGQAIHISSVVLKNGGFVAVSGINAQTNLPDPLNVLNTPVYLPAGIYRNINIPLHDEALVGNNKAVITLYGGKKTGSGLPETVFDPSSEGGLPLKMWNGRIAQKIINLTQ